MVSFEVIDRAHEWSTSGGGDELVMGDVFEFSVAIEVGEGLMEGERKGGEGGGGVFGAIAWCLGVEGPVAKAINREITQGITPAIGNEEFGDAIDGRNLRNARGCRGKAAKSGQK